MVYDAINRLIARTLSNSVTSSYTYQQNTDWVESITHTNATGEVLTAVTYERNLDGTPHTITREDDSYVELEYDSSLRLTRETYYSSGGVIIDEIAYTYDADGNRQSVSNGIAQGTYHYDNTTHQLSSITSHEGNESYLYDESGRVWKIIRDGETLTLNYNANNQLETITDAEGNIITQYTYDAQSRRIEVDDRNYLVAPMVGTELDSPHLITNDNGDVMSSYVYAGAMPLMRLDENGNPVYYLTDAVGSVIGLADDTGASAANFHYDSFGNLRTANGDRADIAGTPGGDFRFQGQWLESNTSLYHFRARYYDPEVGRFISRDPVDIIETEPESSNPYQFVYNNPLIYSDPTGQYSISEINVSRVMQDILNSIRAEVVDTIKQEAINKAQGIAGKLVGQFIGKVTPYTPAYGSVLDEALAAARSGQGGAGDYAGELVEEFVMDVGVCPILEAGGLSRYLWREPIITRGGKPTHSGYQCHEDDGPPHKSRPQPDFVISAFPPKKLQTGFSPRKGWLIGDIKFQTKTIDKFIRGNKDQWQAVYNFAKHRQYAPTALYITFFGDQVQAKKIESAGASKGIVLNVLSLVTRP